MGEAPRDKARIEYDPDTRMLAFLGTLTLLVGSLFWVLLGVRLLLDSDAQAAWAPAAGLTALAMGPLGALCALTAWGETSSSRAARLKFSAWATARKVVMRRRRSMDLQIGLAAVSSGPPL